MSRQRYTFHEARVEGLGAGDYAFFDAKARGAESLFREFRGELGPLESKAGFIARGACSPNKPRGGGRWPSSGAPPPPSAKRSPSTTGAGRSSGTPTLPRGGTASRASARARPSPPPPPGPSAGACPGGAPASPWKKAATCAASACPEGKLGGRCPSSEDFRLRGHPAPGARDSDPRSVTRRGPRQPPPPRHGVAVGRRLFARGRPAGHRPGVPPFRDDVAVPLAARRDPRALGGQDRPVAVGRRPRREEKGRPSSENSGPAACLACPGLVRRTRNPPGQSSRPRAPAAEGEEQHGPRQDQGHHQQQRRGPLRSHASPPRRLSLLLVWHALVFGPVSGQGSENSPNQQ